MARVEFVDDLRLPIGFPSADRMRTVHGQERLVLDALQGGVPKLNARLPVSEFCIYGRTVNDRTEPFVCAFPVYLSG